jgi:hypothetical protein
MTKFDEHLSPLANCLYAKLDHLYGLWVSPSSIQGRELILGLAEEMREELAPLAGRIKILSERSWVAPAGQNVIVAFLSSRRRWKVGPVRGDQRWKLLDLLHKVFGR